jgi:hypothetical protein
MNITYKGTGKSYPVLNMKAYKKSGGLAPLILSIDEKLNVQD